MIYKVSPKDWERMQDLIDRNQDGDGVAAKIKDVNKAAARFIAGTILYGNKENVLKYNGIYWSHFDEFGKRAMRLGAKEADLIESLKEAQVPEDFGKTHVTKKAYRGYTGTLNRFLDKMKEELGVEIAQEYTNYKDWSYETKHQYDSNGRVWPLNYRFTARKGDKEVTFTVIVVTNEGGGLYGYDLNRYRRPWSGVQQGIREILETLINP